VVAPAKQKRPERTGAAIAQAIDVTAEIRRVESIVIRRRTDYIL